MSGLKFVHYVALLLIGLVPVGAYGDSTQLVRGMLIAKQKAVLSSGLSAIILDVNVRFGGRFQTGQTLVQYDCNTSYAMLKKANAELAGAQAKHQNNQLQSQYGSVGSLEISLSAADVAKFEAEKEQIEIAVSRCNLLAPFSGRVVKLHVDPHQFIREGEPLMEVVNDSSLEVMMYVPSEWLQWLTPRHSFTLNVTETLNSYGGKIDVIGATVDAASRTVELRGVLDRPARELIPGMSGSVKFSAH
ncbi:conserved hypothetical protein [Magnetococcus marinus MC-1]|uniref:CusB-like beta-barrel domain-containing protein n=1 Tax=Magnetococcus marinus (strain ATCC BAA-1437 / JCM 17883 / MC-1) TaxID=156889 RepID=A0L6R9_MAGMM|nr:HlyD family efflux transporter periplasmic adaptor subunit [Magnetococcus marinus]ABK43662.1 conserved hypothetical protein [Magnetococcus marinus MC-1]